VSKAFKRVLRYQGNLNEYQGRWYEPRSLYSQSSRYWRQAGDIARQLHQIAVTSKSKQRFIDHYKNQAATRWARSADLASRAGQVTGVDELAEQANGLWQTDQPSN
jgi:hypothetical protein